MKIITLIAVAALLTGCAPARFYNPNVTDGQAQIDLYECQQQGQAAAMGNMFIGADMTQRCMRVRGYTQQ